MTWMWKHKVLCIFFNFPSSVCRYCSLQKYSELHSSPLHVACGLLISWSATWVSLSGCLSSRSCPSFVLACSPTNSSLRQPFFPHPHHLLSQMLGGHDWPFTGPRLRRRGSWQMFACISIPSLWAWRQRAAAVRRTQVWGVFWCVSASRASSSCLRSCLSGCDGCWSAGKDCWRDRKSVV